MWKINKELISLKKIHNSSDQIENVHRKAYSAKEVHGKPDETKDADEKSDKKSVYRKSDDLKHDDMKENYKKNNNRTVTYTKNICIRNNYIYDEADRLAEKFGTRDPFEILEGLKVVVGETDRYKKLKGYCFLSCKTIYVMINTFLTKEEKRIVAAHELGHIILHRDRLKMAPMKDNHLYNMTDNTEYQANIFAAELLVPDERVEEVIKEESDYFTLCSKLYISPELMSFKLYNLVQRGYEYNIPIPFQSNYLAR